MRVLVTGASGFIGQRLCHALRQRGDWVRGLDLQASPKLCDDFVVGDLGRGRLPASAFDGIEGVFHLAGKVHALSEVKADDAEYHRINTEGTREVLAASQVARVRRFVFFSTIKAMVDSAPPGPAEILDENHPPCPRTPYGQSKLEAEHLVLRGSYVPHPVVLRLCLVYGPGVKGNLRSMIDAIKRNRFPPIPDVGNQRSMVHLDDVIQATLLAMNVDRAAGGTYIVSDGESYSTGRIYLAICLALKKPVPAWTVPLPLLRIAGWAGDAIGQLRRRRFFFDSDALAKLMGSEAFSNARICSELGFKRKWTLETALPAMV